MGKFHKDGNSGDKSTGRPNFQHNKVHKNDYKNRSDKPQFQNKDKRKFENNRGPPRQGGEGGRVAYGEKKFGSPNNKKFQNNGNNFINNDRSPGGFNRDGGNKKFQNNHNKGNYSRDKPSGGGGGFQNDKKPFQKNNNSPNKKTSNKKPRVTGFDKYKEKKNRQQSQNSQIDQTESGESSTRIHYVVHPSKMKHLKEAVKDENMSRREQKQKEFKQAKYKKMTILNQKTSKGQPLMKGRMKMLYEKIQKNHDRESKE